MRQWGQSARPAPAQICGINRQSCANTTLVWRPTDTELTSLPRCLKMIFCRLWALGPLAETQKPFSERTLVLLLRKEEWVEFNIEIYFLVSASQILNIARLLLGTSCFRVNPILTDCTSFCSAFSRLSYRLLLIFPSLKLPSCAVIFTNHINWKDCIIFFYIIISPNRALYSSSPYFCVSHLVFCVFFFPVSVSFTYLHQV